MEPDELSGTALKKAHELGKAIVSGNPYEAEAKISLATAMSTLGVSRAMAREVLQVLHGKRLVTLRSRVGAVVRPREEWDLFDRDVIQWRLDSSDRWLQLGALTELREAVEPRAAHLAARNASAETRRSLVALSRELRRLGLDEAETFERDDADGLRHRDRYSAVDVAFHEALLAGSRNEMFQALAEPVTRALEHRIRQDWAGAAARHSAAGFDASLPTQFPRRPAPIALWLHCGLAHAVNQRISAAAEAFAQAILAELQPRGLDQAALRFGLRLALHRLDPEGFDDDEWTGLSESITAAATEPESS